MTVFSWLYMIPSFVAFSWAIMVLLVKKSPTRAQWLMAAFMLVIGVSMVLYSTYFNKSLESEYFLNFLYTTISLYCAPLFYIYVVRQTSIHEVNHSANRAFLPAIIMTILIAAAAILNKAHGCRLFLSQAVHAGDTSLTGPWSYNILLIIGYYGFLLTLVLEIIYTVIISVQRFSQYNKIVAEYYSANKLQWNRLESAAKLVGIAVITITLIQGARPLHQISSVPFVCLISLLQSLALFLIGLYAYHQIYPAEVLARKIHESEIPYEDPFHEKNVMDWNRSLDILSKNVYDDMVDYVEKKQNYLNPDITLISLAEHLHISQSMLINLLHQQRGCTFSEYIDGLRISKAIGILLVETRNPHTQPQRMSDIEYLETLAHQCGYTSAVTFNLGFSHVMGQNYDSWIKDILIEHHK